MLISKLNACFCTCFPAVLNCYEEIQKGRWTGCGRGFEGFRYPGRRPQGPFLITKYPARRASDASCWIAKTQTEEGEGYGKTAGTFFKPDERDAGGGVPGIFGQL